MTAEEQSLLEVPPAEPLAEEEFTMRGQRGGTTMFTRDSDGTKPLARMIWQTTDPDGQQGKTLRTLYLETAPGHRVHVGTYLEPRKVVDYERALNPIFEAGFEPQRLYPRRGGLQMYGLFSHPEYQMPYIFNQGEDGLMMALSFQGSLKPGRGYRYKMGFFRVICKNGLISEVMNLGNLKLPNETGFAEKDLTKWLGHSMRKWQEVDPLTSPLFKSYHPELLSYPLFAIEKLHGRQASDKRDRGWLSVMPSFARAPMLKLENIFPHWAMQALHKELLALAATNDPVNIMQLINGITNVFNGSPTGDPATAGRFYYKLESIIEAIFNLAEVSAFQKGLEPFPVNFDLASRDELED